MKWLFLILSVAYSIGMQSQVFQRFELKKNDEIAFLYPKKRSVLSENAVGQISKQQLYLTDRTQLQQDLQDIMIHLFPDVSEADFSILKKVICVFTFIGNGQCIAYHYTTSVSDLTVLEKWEEQFVLFGESIQKLDYSKYKLLLSDPNHVENNYCDYVVPFSLMKKKNNPQ